MTAEACTILATSESTCAWLSAIRCLFASSASLRVEKAGLERFVYEFAHDWPWLYGLFCVVLAVLAGYAGYLAFNRR